MATDDMMLRIALVEYYAAHGLPADGGAGAPWFHVRLGSIRIPLPNPPARRRALVFHDLNHIATGYNTTLTQGEMAIAGFEIGAGCGRVVVAWFINLWVFALGLCYAPRTLFAAFVRGRRSGSIYHQAVTPEFLATTVGELRQRLRLNTVVNEHDGADVFSFLLWSVLGLALVLVPTLLVLATVWIGVRAVAMDDAARSTVLGTAGLAVAAILAFVITLHRVPVNRDDDVAPKWTQTLIAACVLLQAAHFIEELATHFYQRFPARLGLAPWSIGFFVIFNVVWLLIWALSAARLRTGARIAVFPLWFLAIAMVINGIAHPLLAVDAGGYFPGLITAPAVGVAGAALWMRLLSLTRRAA